MTAIICNNPRWAQAKGYAKTLTDAEEAAFCKVEFPCDFCKLSHPFKTDANNVLCPELRP